MKTVKTRKELVYEGNPYIKYWGADGTEYHQAFITEEACKTRMKELQKSGCKVERMQ